MDIRVLQYFLTVAREGSITRAAEILHMTQPPLSRSLMDLERELGKQLLIRGSRKITLTEDGLILRKRAEEMVELMEKTKAEISSSNDKINGDIYIGGGISRWDGQNKSTKKFTKDHAFNIITGVTKYF